MMFEHQIKGMIAISVFLAFIPFIIYFMPFLFDRNIPVLSTFRSDTENLIIEVVLEDGESGIFFVEPGTAANQLFSLAQINRNIAPDLKLQTGETIIFPPKAGRCGYVIDKIEASKRLALGLPVDVNLAHFDELILIPGIGEVTAAGIVAERFRIGRFEKLDQLMGIKGIKEKKFSKLKQYFYIDDPVNRSL